MGGCRLHEVNDIFFYLIQLLEQLTPQKKKLLEQLKVCLSDTIITPAMIMHLRAYLIQEC